MLKPNPPQTAVDGAVDTPSLDHWMCDLYCDLRRLAQSYVRADRRAPTLQATALVHEAFLKLHRQSRDEWHGRGHFLAIAALVMRRIVLDAARRRAVRHRHAAEAVEDDVLHGCVVRDGVTLDELLAIGEALERLRVHDPALAEVVELRFFVGLEHAEIARHVGVSERTIKRRWRTARHWLYHVMQREAGGAVH